MIKLTTGQKIVVVGIIITVVLALLALFFGQGILFTDINIQTSELARIVYVEAIFIILIYVAFFTYLFLSK